MDYFQSLINTLKDFKKDGVTKSEALACLEFDSDEYPDQDELNEALEIVYGEEK